MQDVSLQHANTFFMFTTIAMCIGIIILLILLYICFKVLKVARRVTEKAYYILDKTSEVVDEGFKEESSVRKGLSFALPILSLFMKKKKKARKTVEK